MCVARFFSGCPTPPFIGVVRFSDVPAEAGQPGAGESGAAVGVRGALSHHQVRQVERERERKRERERERERVARLYTRTAADNK